MSNLILNSSDFGTKIYEKFPPKYREDDIGQKFALRRYLEAIGEGGFKYVIDDVNGLLDVVNPDTTEAQNLKYLLEQFGFNEYQGVPEKYFRYLIPQLGVAWSKKGTIDVIEFISSVLSGISADISVVEENGVIKVKIVLEIEYDEDTGRFTFPKITQFSQIIKRFLPFYVNGEVTYTAAEIKFDTKIVYVGAEVFENRVELVN